MGSLNRSLVPGEQFQFQLISRPDTKVLQYFFTKGNLAARRDL